MSSHIPKNGCVKLDVNGPKNYKPLVLFVFADELFFIIGTLVSSRLGVQMAFTMLLWAITITAIIALWLMKLTRPGFRAWVVILASVYLTTHLMRIL